MKNMDYNAKLKAVGLCTLEDRRHRGDQILLFQMYNIGFCQPSFECLKEQIKVAVEVTS